MTWRHATGAFLAHIQIIGNGNFLFLEVDAQIEAVEAVVANHFESSPGRRPVDGMNAAFEILASETT